MTKYHPDNYEVSFENDESILKLNENKMTDKEAEEILINQLKMIHLRRPNLKDVTLDQLKSYELV